MSNKGVQKKKELSLDYGEAYFVRREVLDDESPTSANLGNDHEFISEE